MSTSTDTTPAAAPAPAVKLGVANAEHLKSQLHANTAGIARAWQEANDAIDGNGYRAMRAATEANPMSLEDLAVWVPKDGNPVEDYVRELHTLASHEDSPAGREILTEINRLMVDSVTQTDAAGVNLALVAKNGTMANGNPDFDKVPLTRIGSNKPKDGDPKTATEAYSRLEAMRDTAEGWVLDAVNAALEACDASSDEGVIDGIRRCAARLQRAQTRANRYRSALFLPFCGPLLDDYEASKPLKPIESFWKQCVAAANAAHKEYMKEHAKNADADALGDAMSAAVNKILDASRGYGVVTTSKTDAQKVVVAEKRLWDTVHSLDKLLAQSGLMVLAVRKTLKAFDVVDPKEAEEEKKDQEKAKADLEKKRADDEARETARIAQAKATADKVAAAAAAKAEREATRKLAQDAAAQKPASAPAGKRAAPATAPAKPSPKKAPPAAA